MTVPCCAFGLPVRGAIQYAGYSYSYHWTRIGSHKMPFIWCDRHYRVVTGMDEMEHIASTPSQRYRLLLTYLLILFSVVYHAPRPMGHFGIARFVRLAVPWRSCVSYRHAGCLQRSHRRPPEMCGLRTRPRTDVDPLRFLDRTVIGGGISSRRPRGDTLFLSWSFWCLIASIFSLQGRWIKMNGLLELLSRRVTLRPTATRIAWSVVQPISFVTLTHATNNAPCNWVNLLQVSSVQFSSVLPLRTSILS